jgi:hypothetical protein
MHACPSLRGRPSPKRAIRPVTLPSEGSNLYAVISHSDAEAYICGLGRKVRPLANEAHAIFVHEQCTSYVKTIYVGYDIDGEMVAALYAHADYLEIALALPEDAKSELLVDASHLTWRTLPVAAVIRDEEDLAELRALIAQAAQRIHAREHDVLRSNDYFIKSRRERNPTGGTNGHRR